MRLRTDDFECRHPCRFLDRWTEAGYVVVVVGETVWVKFCTGESNVTEKWDDCTVVLRRSVFHGCGPRSFGGFGLPHGHGADDRWRHRTRRVGCGWSSDSCGTRLTLCPDRQRNGRPRSVRRSRGSELPIPSDVAGTVDGVFPVRNHRRYCHGFRPRNLWERDQIELFIDGDDLEGSDDEQSWYWWNDQDPYGDYEIYGKFGAGRDTTYEGNSGIMSEFADDIYADESGFVAAAAVASETGENGNWLAEYAISLEPMWYAGTFAGTPTGDQEQVIADQTVIKYTVAVSDDDNFDNDATERSHAVTYYRAINNQDVGDWWNSASFADLTFVGEYSPIAAPQLQAGDADQDLKFDQLDLVQVQIAAKYLSGQPATWGEGDWDGAPGGLQGSPPPGNGLFDQLDIIAALGAGKYLTGPYAAIAGRAAGRRSDVNRLQRQTRAR